MHELAVNRPFVADTEIRIMLNPDIVTSFISASCSRQNSLSRWASQVNSARESLHDESFRA